MTDKEKELWLSVKYPITIISDRYDGTYSGASWLAFPLDYDKIPEDVDGDDMLCSHFWKNYKEPVGKGGCAEEAIDNLLLEMEPTESRDERIRKKIKSYLEAIRDGAMMCFNTSEEIAWLEKQKENPKSADSIPSNCVSDVKCENRWLKVGDFLPDNGRDVLAKDALGNFLIANYDGDRRYISGYDNEDKPIVYTPAIKEWCDIPSEKRKEQMPKWKKNGGLLRFAILEDENGRYIQHDGYKIYFNDLLKLPKED